MDTTSEGVRFATVIYMLPILPRDELVSGAVGQASYRGVSYYTTAQNINGLLAAGSVGVNHGTPVAGPFVKFSPN